ncbi:Arc family DNA-binding protein [Acidobacteria bacterium AH-259-L09]|nr:Arc family DNA-binding protein [Acidobacteria bacterium AH-259-L09]
MATLHVRNVPEEIYEKLKKRASAENRSISAQTIALLRNALQRPPRSPGEILDQIRERSLHYQPQKGRSPDSTRLIREDRNR